MGIGIKAEIKKAVDDIVSHHRFNLLNAGIRMMAQSNLSSTLKRPCGIFVLQADDDNGRGIDSKYIMRFTAALTTRPDDIPYVIDVVL